MKLFRVVWDQEYCNNCHDEVLTDWLTEEKANEFIGTWVQRKLDSLRLPKSEENVSALKAQLSYETKDFDFNSIKIPKRLVADIEESLIGNTAERKRSLELGFGNSEYIKECIDENKNLTNMLRYARTNGLKVKISIE